MLENRTILVTGAAGGLGQVICQAVIRAGGRLLMADIDKDRGVALAQDMGADFVWVDLSDPQSINDLATTITDKTNGTLHGLVNNGAIATGIGGIGFEDITIDSWDTVMNVNVRGTWLMCRAMAPLLRSSQSGRIVNVASDTALWGAPNLMSYVASKGAVMAMTRSLARELGSDNIGVTAIAPGILTTPSTEYVPEHRHQLYEQGRAVTGKQNPEDIVDSILFLLSEKSLCLTGQTLPINNGFVFN